MAGDGALAVFRRAAVDDREELRQAAILLLYLKWRPDADNPTTRLMADLASGVKFGGVVLRKRDRLLLDFLAGLSITIYINNCDNPRVAQQVSDLWEEVLKDRLRLHQLNLPIFEKLFTPLMAVAYSGRLLATLSGLQDPAVFFAASAADKAVFKRVVPLLDPAADPGAALPDLARLFASKTVLDRVLAALVLAVHAHNQPDRAEPWARELFEGLDARGRQWVVIAFSVLIRSTPARWVELLEELTARFVKEERQQFLLADAGTSSGFDVDLLALGLAYGKAGAPMAVFETLLTSAIADQDTLLAQRVVGALAPVGFYYPKGVLETLWKGAPQTFQGELGGATVTTLSTMRTLHADAVDLFLRETGAPPVLARQVSERTGVELVRRHVLWIGIYNNAVHEALFYPWMRRELLIGALDQLVEASSGRDFIKRITPGPMRMLRQSNYRPIEWTRGEGPS